MQPWPKSGPGWARCHAELRACSSGFSACTFVARERRGRGSPIYIHDEAGPDLSRRAPALMSRCKLIYSVCCRQAFSRPGALLRRLCARHPTRFPPPVGKAHRGRLLSPRKVHQSARSPRLEHHLVVRLVARRQVVVGRRRVDDASRAAVGRASGPGSRGCTPV